MMQLENDDFLVIQVLGYHATEKFENFYFLEMSTLQATTLLQRDRKIVLSKIVAYTKDSKYLDQNTIESFRTIGEFNEFFLNNPGYCIHDCEIELEKGLLIQSHDDGEVSIQFNEKNCEHELVDSIFRKYKLDASLIAILKSKLGHYISIDRDNNVTGDFETFDEYLANDQK